MSRPRAIGTALIAEPEKALLDLVHLSRGDFPEERIAELRLDGLRRRYDLAWTAVFLANFTAWTFAAEFSWAGVLAIQIPVTALVIALEIRSPRYHGVLAARFNRRLAEYLDRRIG